MTPALMRASKVAKKSGEYKSISNEELILQIKDQLSVLSSDSENADNSKLGEMLFNISALSSKLNIDPEEALFKYTNQFINKYKN